MSGAQKKGAHMPGQKGRAFGPESPRAEPKSCRRATCKAAPAAPQGLKARLPGIYERTYRHALWPVLSEVRRSDTQALVWGDEMRGMWASHYYTSALAVHTRRSRVACGQHSRQAKHHTYYMHMHTHMLMRMSSSAHDVCTALH